MKQSTQLKQAMEEIQNILRKHDLMGFVMLSDGHGRADYIHHWWPSWSCMFKEGLNGMRIQAKSSHPESRAKAERTVNAVFTMAAAIAEEKMTIDRLCAIFKDHMTIEAGDLVRIQEQEEGTH